MREGNLKQYLSNDTEGSHSMDNYLCVKMVQMFFSKNKNTASGQVLHLPKICHILFIYLFI